AECLAARTPIVVPRLGGLPETVRDGIDGLVFNGLDAADLARQLDRLALEPGLLEQLQAGIEAPRPFGAYIDELEEYYGGSHALRPQPERRAAVRWKGEHGQPLSLSIINDQITARLSGPLQRVNADGTALDPPLPHPAAVEVHQQWPPDLTPPGAGAMAAIIPWEFGSVPADWVTSVNRHIDELWVPSEFVRNMYVADGVEAERVVAIPNGVDLDAFHPVSEAELAARTGGTRFLFVGGLTWRKGPDLLLGAYIQAFSGRDDVTLVVKGFGSNTVYATGAREPIREYANSGQLPRVELSDESLTESELAELFRSCDVLVHPYRGEGFGMPVLEAMASGLPVIVTAGGPTDEFCPSEAGWRIRASRKQMDPAQLGQFSPSSTPWILEPELDHLIELLREADRDLAGRRARGRAARAAAEQLSWEAVTERYQQRIDALASRPPKLAHIPSQPFPLTEEVKLRVLATPAWRGRDRLAELLREWGQATTPQTSACLYLLADPAVAGEPAEIEAHVVQAAQRGGLNLESCADINVLMEAFRADRDQRLQLAVDAYVPLHAACAGQRRYAARAGTRVIEPGAGEVAALLSASDSASRPDGR
ncbi:MAG TPA: glycosyltransferase, partial [Solirubrobacteraceae bacterium]|nr:glycosyltransferase [Solirubrobacteraceae bacterium]